MLKLALIATFGLTVATLSLNDADSHSAIGACEVSSRAEAIQWGQTNPGLSHVAACRANGG